jgi:hypothetical protein
LHFQVLGVIKEVDRLNLDYSHLRQQRGLRLRLTC